jgi:hypothetical protein
VRQLADGQPQSFAAAADVVTNLLRGRVCH